MAVLFYFFFLALFSCSFLDLDIFIYQTLFFYEYKFISEHIYIYKRNEGNILKESDDISFQSFAIILLIINSMNEIRAQKIQINNKTQNKVFDE